MQPKAVEDERRDEHRSALNELDVDSDTRRTFQDGGTG